MSRSGQPAVLVGTYAMPPGTRFSRHVHGEHQLAWAATGVMTVDTDAGSWVLPPSRALWIPAGVPHEVVSTGRAVMRSLYLSVERCPIRWPQPTAVQASPLLAELIGRLGDQDLPVGPRRRTEAVLFDLLRPVAVASVHAPLPRDERALDVARRLLTDPDDRRGLDEWGRAIGASGRTLARAFRDETGVPFGRWRTAVRVGAALPLLAAGEPVGRVAHRVGYDTASAFVAAFRRETGVTPGAYFDERVSVDG